MSKTKTKNSHWPDSKEGYRHNLPATCMHAFQFKVQPANRESIDTQKAISTFACQPYCSCSLDSLAIVPGPQRQKPTEACRGSLEVYFSFYSQVLCAVKSVKACIVPARECAISSINRRYLRYLRYRKYRKYQRKCSFHAPLTMAISEQSATFGYSSYSTKATRTKMKPIAK